MKLRENRIGGKGDQRAGVGKHRVEREAVVRNTFREQKW